MSKLFKVVGRDNINVDGIPDVLLLESGTKEECEAFARAYVEEHMCKDSGYYNATYYPFYTYIDTKLWKGSE